MDEVQSWWEVPAVALFCNAFRNAFNILFFDISELEAAILNVQDPEMCVSLEQLIIRILEGCYNEGEVTSANWEKKLHDLFTINFEDKDNPFLDDCFLLLTPRSKVELLLKLCECRIDADGAFDAIKDIPSENMQAKCVGKDSQNNAYWYFCDERLYKEDLSAPKSRKRDAQGNTKSSKPPLLKNGKRASTREKKPLQVETSPWSIECHNVSDWEMLSKKFFKSKVAAERELAKQIKDKYIPLLAEVVASKDRFLRQRFLKFQPKRSSSRISKVQAQKKMEEQIAADVAEEKRMKHEKEEAEKEAKRKQEEKDSRKKRAEERERKIQERSIRALKRDMMSGRDYFGNDDSSNPAHSETKSEHSSNEESSGNEESEESEEEEESENNATSRTLYESRSNVTSSVSVNGNREKTFVQPNYVQKPSELYSKWSTRVDHKGHKIHVLNSYEDTKQMNSRNGNSYSPGKDDKTPCYKVNSSYQPFRQRNLNSCTKVTPSPAVIRLDFIKPSSNHQRPS